MPRGDGTGPMGMGPMTGRGAGYCAGNQMPRYDNSGMGMGRGMGFNQGRRYRRTFFFAGLLPRCVNFVQRWVNRRKISRY